MCAGIKLWVPYYQCRERGIFILNQYVSTCTSTVDNVQNQLRFESASVLCHVYTRVGVFL